MISGEHLMEELRATVAPGGSRPRCGIIKRFVDDLANSRLRTFGGTINDPADYLTSPDVVIYSYLLTESLYGPRPIYRVVVHPCSRQTSYDDWSLMRSLVIEMSRAAAEAERCDLESIVITGLVRASLLVAVVDQHYFPIFLIPKELSPVQGMIALYRTIMAREDRLYAQFVKYQESIQ